jgi:toxin YoeB
MGFLFKAEAEKDLDYWYKKDKSVIKKIESLLKSMEEDPYSGIGHPEQLRANLSGYWSRRINLEHRIIYTVEGEIITIYSLKGHYDDK